MEKTAAEVGSVMNQPSSPLEYRPLNPLRNETRVIELFPLPGPDAVIQCRLRHVDLDHGPEFNALSYVWGDPNVTTPISINGSAFNITANLDAALRQLAFRQSALCPWVLRQSALWQSALQSARWQSAFPENHTITIWVDAICINQHDEAERSQQVSRMDRIFAAASQTIVWLGVAGTDSATAMAALSWLGSIPYESETGRFSWLVKSRSSYHGPYDPWLANLMQLSVFQDHFQGTKRTLSDVSDKIFEDGGRIWDALNALFQRDWFRRVWVIQELALSTYASVFCGDREIKWPLFYKAFCVLCVLRDFLQTEPLPQPAPRPRLASLFYTARRPRTEPRLHTVPPNSSALVKRLTAGLDCITPVVHAWRMKKLELRYALYQLAGNAANQVLHLQASDKRDFVFALLGLAEDNDKLDIRPDYSEPSNNTRKRVAEACLKSYGLEILSFCSNRPILCAEDNGIVWSGAPSWAPNWDPRYLPQPLCVWLPSTTGDKQREKAYHPTKSLRYSIDEASFTGEGNLMLPAMHVGTIVESGSSLDDVKQGCSLDDETAIMKAWLENLNTLLPRVNQAYDSKEKVFKALWKTPIADRRFAQNYRMERASRKMRAGYHAVLHGIEKARLQPEAQRYMDIAYYKLRARRSFRTSQGLIGIGPEDIVVGDCVEILFGADSPMILRDDGSDSWCVVGEAYVHGMMDGEILQRNVAVEMIKLR